MRRHGYGEYCDDDDDVVVVDDDDGDDEDEQLMPWDPVDPVGTTEATRSPPGPHPLEPAVDPTPVGTTEATALYILPTRA